jgi:Zn-dependent protease with chaperone function
VIRQAPTTLALIAMLCGSMALANDEPLDHKIPPGYEPEEARDEQGLWMEFEEMERTLNKSALLVRDPDINNYITEIVCRVAAEYCNDFRVYVIRNPGFNASMTATGMMQIWTGLIVRANSTDEIAAVVGHEIAHYTRLHSLQRLRDMKAKLAAGSVFDIALLLATGYNTPLGQMTAMMSVLSFSREQETEADLLGTRILAEASYNPHASYRVWQRIIAEEEAAAVKRREPSTFSKTHPASEQRASYLEALVVSTYGQDDVEQVADDKLLAILNTHYLFLMEDQLDTNRFGRTKELLERHRSIGVEPSLVYYFYGEMFRQRDEEGDKQLAMDAYLHSIEAGGAPGDAYKNLGYLHLKTGDTVAAQVQFRKYLEVDPAADDRAMIEFYLEE